MPTSEDRPESDAGGGARVLDLAALTERCMGDRAFALEMLGQFVASLDGVTASLHACVRSGDLHGAARAAHTLKGAALTCGAGRLGALAAEGERCARTGDGPGLARVGAELEGACLALRAEAERAGAAGARRAA
jgi:HPt (histidine-containing phosphotransfer) domain-containing protein